MSDILESADVALARVLFSAYRNTDIAARFILEEIHRQAKEARNA